MTTLGGCCKRTPSRSVGAASTFSFALQLDLTLDEFQTSSTSSQGAGNEHLWEFVACAPGHSLLQLAYRRRWESVPPTRSFSLRVSVT